MRVKYQFAICLAFFCASASAQTGQPVFQAGVPTNVSQADAKNDARYYAQVENLQFTVKVVAGVKPEATVTHVRSVQSKSFPSNSDPNSLQVANYAPQVDQRTVPYVAEQASINQKPATSSQVQFSNDEMSAEYLAAQFESDTSNVQAATLSQDFLPPIMSVGITQIDSTPTYITDPTPQNYDHPVTEIKNHFFFGVDREACCDEWADYCKCGGLKANPGHWGLPWLRGNDPCECTECALRNYRNERRSFRTNDLGSDCDSRKSGGGVLGKPKRTKCTCAACDQ